MVTDTDHGREQAKAQAASIVAMVARLAHAQTCDNDGDCDLTDADLLEGLGLFSGTRIIDLHYEEYHYEEHAGNALSEDPLSVEVRSNWHEPGDDDSPGEFTILLCTGGPAVRIMVELYESAEPHRAWLEYQDWGTPWTQYFDVEGATLLAYAQHFYYGG